MRRGAITAVLLLALGATLPARADDAADCSKNIEALIKTDPARAVSACRKLADHGKAQAQFNLGVMYRDGLAVPQDYGTAMGWFRKAADQGFAKAQYELGVMCRDGLGVPQDYGIAIGWFRKAADQGFAVAQYDLGVLYRDGQGVQD